MIDPNSNAVNASAAVSRSTGTPVTYERPADDSGYISMVPAMTLSVPGVQPFTVGCNHVEKGGCRFSWSANVPITRTPPTCLLSAADLLTLDEKFGLAADLQDTARKG